MFHSWTQKLANVSKETTERYFSKSVLQRSMQSRVNVLFIMLVSTVVVNALSYY